MYSIQELDYTFTSPYICVMAQGPLRVAQETVLLNGIQEEFTNLKYCDVTLVNGKGRTFKSHRLVLAAISPFFRKVLNSVTFEEDMMFITLPDVDFDLLRTFLKQVYTAGSGWVVDIDPGLAFLQFDSRPTIFNDCTKFVPFESKTELDELKNEADLFYPEREIKQEFLAFDYEESEELCDVFDDVKDDEDYEPSYPPPPKKRKVSIKRKKREKTDKDEIWKLYSVIDNDNATCLLCKMNIRTEGGSGSALTRHSKFSHPEDFEKFLLNQSNSSKDSGTTTETKISVKIKPETTGDLPIWKYFTSQEENLVRCNACGIDIKCRSSNDTSPLFTHLCKEHKDLHLKYLQDMKAFVKERGSKAKEVTVKVKNGEQKVPKKRGRKKKNPDGDVDPDSRTCPECKKVFSCRNSMLYHQRVVHSGIRPFKCDECGMTFARKDSFQSHTHEKKERSFLCSVCGKTFARRNIRDVHERTHYGDKRFNCSFCDKKFMTNQQKRNHERVHTGERPYQCTDCGRQFAQQHQLTTHYRIHTGEMPYSCTDCGLQFRHLSSKNTHKCANKRKETQFHDAVFVSA